MNKHNCYICNSIISEDWLEVSEGVNDTKECYECFKKEQRGREWERSQTNDLLGRDDQIETPQPSWGSLLLTATLMRSVIKNKGETNGRKSKSKNLAHQR